jgi:hypothetical protein
MASSADALKIVQSLVRRTRNARVAYQALLAYAEKYLARAADQDASLEAFADNPATLMPAFLVELEKEQKLQLTYTEGAITAVFYPTYYVNLVHEAYDQLDARPDGPFPTDESLPVPIPNDLVSPIDIKTDFVRWLGQADREQPGILRIMYPEDIHSMIVSTDMLADTLPKMSVQKIRQYLRSEKNAGYIRSKLSAVFRQREMAMKDMLTSIMTTPDQALKSIFSPTDFSFHFWTQLSSTIIKEYSQKKEKLVEEHGHCQAAYMIGYFNVYHRGLLQKKRDTETALKQLDAKLHKAPYTYTISEIHNFTDSRGVPLTKKYSLQDVNRYISERLAIPEDKGLSDLVRIKTPEGKEYYIHKQYILPVTLDRVFDARRTFRDHYVDKFTDAMKNQRRLPEMTDDAKFEKSVEARLQDEEPMLHSLLRFNLLYLARDDTNVAPEIVPEVQALFNAKGTELQRISVILNLDRKKLHSDAKLLLPFWQAIPLLSKLVGLLKRIFVGRRDEPVTHTKAAAKKKSDGVATTMRYSPSGEPPSAEPPESDAPAPAPGRSGDSRRAQVARFKEAVRQLQQTYVRPGSTPEKTLQDLIDRWNPLLDPVAKDNLVEDINSLSRDFLRRMKVSFRLVPPTRSRVEEWADRLSRNQAFSQIRRTDDLKEYLQLYMLTLLGK